jgi:hypothetical protein
MEDDTIPFTNYLNSEKEYFAKRQEFIKNNERYGDGEYLDHPFLFCSRQSLTSSLFRIRIYERILDVHGAIVECGVHRGNGFMLFNQLVSIHEPYNLTRSVIGFDTFEGFASINAAIDEGAHENHFSDAHLEDLQEALRLHDMNRAVPHVRRGELVKGDATETIPAYVEENPHLVVALLYLDFDIYEPTKVALEHLLPLMPKGGIVAFDELAVRHWPGETRALKELVDLNGLRLRRFPFEAYASYAVIGD